MLAFNYNLIVFMIIVKSLLRNCVGSVIFKNSGGFKFSKGKERDRFIQAIFQDDIKQISLMDKQQRQNFKMTYNLSGESLSQEIVKQTMEDINILTATLQFASNQSRKVCKNLIVCQQYIKLICKYYQYFHVGSVQKTRNKTLNSNFNINHLIPTFIHLRNPQIRKTIKENQQILFQVLNKQKKLSLQQIMRIIHTNIYNITDLPVLQRIFFQQIYPKVYELTNPQQLCSALQYLHFFNMLPLNLFQHTIHKIQTYLVGNTKRQLKDDLIWMQLMALLALKSDRYQFIGKQQKTIFFNCYNKLVQFKYAIGEKKCSVQQIFTSETSFSAVIHHLIQSSPQQMRESNNYNIDFESNRQLYPPIIIKIMQNYKKINDQLASKEKIRQYVQIQLWITIAKILLCGRSFDLNLNSFHVFFSTKKSKDILQKYAYYPNLFKDIIIAHQKIQAESKNYSNDSKISKMIFQFKEKTNKTLKQLLHSDKQQTIKKYTPINFQFNTIRIQHIWNLNSDDAIKNIIHYRQDYSIRNLLGMLSTDPIFLQSRLKLTITDYTKIQLLENSFNDQNMMGEWDYPHWFPIILLDDSGTPNRIIPKTIFNKFLILPKTLPPNTFYHIKYNANNIFKLHKMKLKNEQQSIR